MSKPDDTQWPAAGLQAEAEKLRQSTLASAVADMDKIIELMEKTRESIIAPSSDPLAVASTLTRLQPAFRQGFEAVNSDLKEVTKAQRLFGKALDKNMPLRPLPTETDPMGKFPNLINRAIFMHLLREGKFEVGNKFVAEAIDHPPNLAATAPRSQTPTGPVEMSDGAAEGAGASGASGPSGASGASGVIGTGRAPGLADPTFHDAYEADDENDQMMGGGGGAANNSAAGGAAVHPPPAQAHPQRSQLQQRLAAIQQQHEMFLRQRQLNYARLQQQQQYIEQQRQQEQALQQSLTPQQRMRHQAQQFLRRVQDDSILRQPQHQSEELETQLLLHEIQNLYQPLSGPGFEVPSMTLTVQHQFGQMYGVLDEIKAHNLGPAVEWASLHAAKLDRCGSTLEFDLARLQFIWLLKGPAVNQLPDDEQNGWRGALAYGRARFPAFSTRYGREIRRLSAAAFAFGIDNESSPYAGQFDMAASFQDTAVAFTREFCSLLGLSEESPLYVAVTAGALALPQLIKYTGYMKAKKTEWTFSEELAFETPLPPSMVYHPIFVCPVLKVQTTIDNPAMMLPCGHVMSSESVQNMAKAVRCKCPYCPTESHVKDAIAIVF